LRYPISILAAFFAALTVAGCASTKVTGRETYRGERLARPGRIFVHDFAATAAALPAWSEAKSRVAAPAQRPSAEELATGRQLGDLVAADLVAEIRAMGLPAVRTAGQPAPELGDVALVGYFASIDEGSRMKRVVIGFGSGTAELKTEVEGYLRTEAGWRKLGAGDVEAGGAGKTPGVVVPIIVTAATANPIGLAVGGAVKAHGELTGRTTIEGAAQRTAQAIADELREAFRKQGWI
jgi:uncharacterized protein DUF4410